MIVKLLSSETVDGQTLLGDQSASMRYGNEIAKPSILQAIGHPR